MICKACGESFPHKTGSYCGTCLPRCKSCGHKFAGHLDVEGLCANNQKLRSHLSALYTLMTFRNGEILVSQMRKRAKLVKKLLEESK